MSRGWKTLITLLLILIAIILFDLYKFNILPWYICIIAMIFSVIIYGKIVGIKKIFSLLNNEYNIDEDKSTYYQDEQLYEDIEKELFEEMSDEEKQEKSIFFKIFIIFVSISLILFLTMMLLGKLNMDLLQIWLFIMAFVLEIIIMPKARQKSIINKIIFHFVDIIAYTAIILGIVWILFKFVFKLI